MLRPCGENHEPRVGSHRAEVIARPCQLPTQPAELKYAGFAAGAPSGSAEELGEICYSRIAATDTRERQTLADFSKHSAASSKWRERPIEAAETMKSAVSPQNSARREIARGEINAMRMKCVMHSAMRPST